MHSRAGSQVPFSSINLGIPYSNDAALICKIFLEEYEKGLGKGEQPIFPNIIFRVKSGVNRESTDPYHYLYKLACRVAAKRMNPTFMNIDADFNKEYNVSAKPINPIPHVPCLSIGSIESSASNLSEPFISPCPATNGKSLTLKFLRTLYL